MRRHGAGARLWAKGRLIQMWERDVLAEIEQELTKIEEGKQVRILLAVESGSRAWGFASPDSDYDVRFIYMRRPEDYLRLEERKDVIEWQLDKVLDINGWDLRKALVQFHRGNATLFEWSNSPIVYRGTELWERIYAEAGSCFSRKAAVCHYYGTARSAYMGYLQKEQVSYKKYFYALRPLLACRYIEQYDRMPPVPFGELLRQDMPSLLRQEIDHLLERKKVTEEKDKNPQIPAIREFIAQELERQKALGDAMEDDRRRDWEGLNRLFYRVLKMEGL